jgi:hypothetical protein
MKVTEGRQWAHVLCASWTPEVQFTNVAAFKTIENISSVALDRWQGVSLVNGIKADKRYVPCVDNKMALSQDVRIADCFIILPALGQSDTSLGSNSVS